METVNIHQAKTHLSRLIQQALQGHPFIIAKAGKPLVKVEAVSSEPMSVKRFGMMKGLISVPDNFDALGREEIERQFGLDH
ncbi:type II toxin-antitoxin system Phd/YefM family antitoxin [Brevundimonas balnearis]|uniref:Antitoxin n=1 Tax=Brevundimonas balnearis TaxID=1572858 RepID=A0ABV6R3I9_9CAUL